MAENMISAMMVERAFDKNKKRFLTMNQLRDKLSAEERRQLGLTQKSKPGQITPLLNDLSGPYAIIKKGRTAYVVGSPLEELLEAFLLAPKPGKTIGEAARFLPMTKPDIIETANRLLKMGRLRAEISSSEKIKLYPAEPCRTPVSSPSGGAAGRSAAADPTGALKAVYDSLAVGKRHVYIYMLRRQLGWPRQEFDRLLDRLFTEGRVAGFPGDPSRLSSDEVKDSFQGRDGELYIALAWRRRP